MSARFLRRRRRRVRENRRTLSKGPAHRPPLHLLPLPRRTSRPGLGGRSSGQICSLWLRSRVADSPRGRRGRTRPRVCGRQRVQKGKGKVKARSNKIAFEPVKRTCKLALMESNETLAEGVCWTGGHRSFILDCYRKAGRARKPRARKPRTFQPQSDCSLNPISITRMRDD